MTEVSLFGSGDDLVGRLGKHEQGDYHMHHDAWSDSRNNNS